MQEEHKQEKRHPQKIKTTAGLKKTKTKKRITKQSITASVLNKSVLPVVVCKITNTTPFMQHRCNMKKERSRRTQLRNPPFSVSPRRGSLNHLRHLCTRHVTGLNWRRTERGYREGSLYS